MRESEKLKGGDNRSTNGTPFRVRTHPLTDFFFSLSHLKKVILHDVPDDAKPVEIAPSSARAEIFLERDLDRVDVLVRPDWFKQLVCEAQRRHVEHDLFPEVMVDAKDLRLVED